MQPCLETLDKRIDKEFDNIQADLCNCEKMKEFVLVYASVPLWDAPVRNSQFQKWEHQINTIGTRKAIKDLFKITDRVKDPESRWFLKLIVFYWITILYSYLSKVKRLLIIRSLIASLENN